MNFLASPFNLSIRPALGVTREEILDDGAGEGNRLNRDRKAISFVSLSSFSLLSLFPTETPNTQATALSRRLKRLSHRVLTFIMEKSSETIAARLPAGADMNRPLKPHWWV